MKTLRLKFSANDFVASNINESLYRAIPRDFCEQKLETSSHKELSRLSVFTFIIIHFECCSLLMQIKRADKVAMTQISQLAMTKMFRELMKYFVCVQIL